MFKKFLSVTMIMFHVMAFSGPSLFASDGAIVTNPTTGETVAEGNNISLPGGTYNYLNADVAAGESRSFTSIDGGAIVLNIVDGKVTNIDGSVTFNDGAFGLSNPFGINVGPTGTITINDGGLILSNLGISEAQLNAGLVELVRGINQETGSVINNGTVTVSAKSFFAMVGSAVSNTGGINANGGAAVLAAGDKVSLDITNGAGLIKVAINKPVSSPVFDSNGNKISDAISNSGSILANGGVAILSASAVEGIFDNVINHTGIIEANSIAEKNGRILLDGGDLGITSVTGTLKAAGDDLGETGGLIEILGEKVGLFDGATVDASGYNGGGTVLVGGDYQGMGSARNAKAVYLSKWADINADATLEGNGGKVILWSDNSTKAYGTISARGGILSGDGGLIETSSANFLDVAGIGIDASARAEGGKAGTWLLDPYKITLGSGGSNTTGGIFSAGTNSTVNVSDINAQLNGGTNVTITASSADGDIELATGFDVSKTSGAGSVNFTLNATRDILIKGTIGGAVTLSGFLNVILNSTTNGDIKISNSINTNGGSVTATTAGGEISLDNDNSDIATAGGAITFTANGNKDIKMTKALSSLSSAGGIISLIASKGADINGTINSGAGTISITGNNGSVKVSNALTANNANIALTASNDVALDGATADIATNGGKFTATASGKFTKNNAGSSVTTAGGDISATASEVDINGPFNSGGGKIDLTSTTTTADKFIISNAITSGGGNITFNSKNGIKLDKAASDITTSGGSFTANADSDGDASGTFNLSDADASVNTGAGTLDVTAANIALTGTLSTIGVAKLQTSTAGRTIGLGGGTGDFNITDAEGDKISAGTLEIGKSNAGNIKVADFSPSSASKLVLRTGGSVTEEAADAGADLTVADLGIQSATGVNVDVDVTNLGVANSGAGGVDVTDTTGGMTINDITNSGATISGISGGTGGVTLAATGSTVALAADVSATDSNITFNSGVTASGTRMINAGTGTVDFNAAVAAGSSDLTVRGNGIDFDGGAGSVTGSGQLKLEPGAASASIGVTTGQPGTLQLDTDDLDAIADGHSGITIGRADGTGTVTIGAYAFQDPVAFFGGALVFAGVLSSTGTLTLNSIGSITSTIDGIADFIADTIQINAATGINVEINATNIGFTNTTSGDVVIEDTAGGLTVNSVSSNAGGGLLTIITHSPLTIAADLIQAGTINLTAGESGAAGDDLTVNAGVTVQATGAGSDVNLNAGDNVVLGAGSTVQSDTAAVNITAGAGDTDAAGSISLGGLVSAVTTATLNALVGSITDTNAGTNNIAAASVSATALNGIDFDTNVTNITASNTGAGNIAIDEADGANVLNVNAVNGDATVTTATGDLAVTTVGASGTAVLTATAGAITDANAGANNVTAASLNATAATGVDLDTTVADLTASNTGAGNIAIDEADGANVLNVNAANGDATVTSTTGDLAVTTVGASGTATLTATAGAITDANAGTNNVTAASLNATAATGIDLDTTVADLTASNTGAGNIAIDEADGANILSVIASNGGATVTSLTGDLVVTILNAIGGTAVLTATAGAITDANAGANNVTAVSLNATAATGVDLDTTVTNLTASNTGAGNINLDEADGANVLNVNAVNGDATVTSAAGDLNVSTVSASGTAVLTATTGAITNTGGTNVSANALSSTAATGISLTTDVTDLTASNTGAGDVVINEVNGANVLSATAANGNVNITSNADLNVTTVGASGTATLTSSTGAITDANAGTNNVTAATASLNAADGIDLDTTVSNISFNNTTSGDVNLFNTGALTVTSGSNAGSGILTILTASPLTIAADLIQAGTINLTAGESGAAGDDLTVGAFTVRSTAGDVNLSAGDNVDLQAGSTVQSTTGAVNVTSANTDADDAGDISLAGIVSAATTLTLNAITQAAGNLGAITQTSGSVTAANLAVNADGNVDLSQAGNDVDNLTATTGTDLDFVDADEVELGASTIGNDLTVSAGGNVTDSGPLSVTGTTDVQAVGDITLDDAGNDFNTVKVNGTNITLNDTDGINLDNSTIGGFLTVTAGGLIDFIGSAATTVAGAMNLTTTTGGITDSGTGSVAVTGATTLDAGAANDITLNNTANNFSSVAVTAANNVTLNDADAINLDNSTISGFLTVTAGGLIDFIGNAATTVAGAMNLTTTTGGITDSGTGSVAVTGATTLDAGAANDITLNNTANNFSSVAVTAANNVTLNDADAINLDNSTISGFLTVTAGGLIDFIGNAATTVAGAMNLTTTTGGITDSGTGSVAVTGATTLDAGAANDITLNNTANNFSSVAVTAANNVTLNDADAINLDNSTISGFLTVTAGGLIDFIGNAATTVAGAMNLTTTTGGIDQSGSGSVAVTGLTTLEAGAANNITLGGNNDFGTVKITSANNASLNDADDLDLGDSTVTGTLDVATGTSLTDSGNVLAASFKFDAGTSVLLDANNDFDTIAGISAGTIGINDIDSLSVGSVNGTDGINSTNNTINIEVGGDLTLDKAVNAGSGDVTLTAAGFIREGAPTDDAAPVADVIGKNIFLNSDVAAPGDALGEALSYLDIQVTDTATGSWNVGVPNSGNVYINCIGDCPIGQVDVGTATFNFSTSGTLLDGNDDVFGEGDPLNPADGDWNIKAGGINVKTGTGFGTLTDAIELRLAGFGGVLTDAGRMAVDGGTGGVFASNLNQLNAAGLQIGGVAGSFVPGVTAATGVKILSGSPLTIAADVTSAAGDIFLAALGNAVTDDVNVNANVSLTGGNGSNSIIAGHDVLVNGTSVVSNTGTGEVELLAGEDATDNVQNQDGNANGSVTMSATSSATTAGGDILLDAALDVVVSTANAGAGIATLLARAGSVNGADATNLVTASAIDADAVTGIGNTTTLNTAASTIDADTTNGNIDINNNLATAVNAASLTTGTGTINFDQDGDGALTVTSATTTDGTITITNDNAAITATSVVAGGTGNANLTTTTAGDINLGNVDAAGDTATINAAGGIRGVTDDATADVTAGTVNLTAAAGGISGFAAGDSLDVTSTTALNADTTADNGLIMIDHIGNANLGLVNANTGTVIIDGTGTIDSVTNDGVADVVGGSVTLNSNGAIGGTSAVDFTATTDINANSNGNNIFLDGVNGDVKVGLITAGAGNVTLNATDKIDSVTDDATADVVGATVNLNALEAIGGNSVLDVTATTALNASTPGENITLDSIGNAIVGLITTGSTAAGVVTLESTGAINSLNDDGAADIVAKTINLVALVGGIGTSSILEVSAGGATINADTTADNGNIILDSIGDAIIGLITAGTGNVTLVSTGKIDSTTNDAVADIVGTNINLTALAGGIGTSSVLDVTALGRFDATTTADNGNILVDSIGDFPVGVVNAGSGDVTLNSTGNMTDADLDQLANVIGGTINLTTTGSDIGVGGSLENYFDIQPATLWNAATNGGDLYVNCLGVCPTGLVDLGTGNGYLAVGTMTDGNDTVFGEFNGGLVNIIAGGFEIDSVNGIGSSTNAIEMRLGDFNAVQGHGRFIADGGTAGVFATNDRVLPGVFGLDLNTLPGGLLTSITATDDIIIFSGSPMDINVNVTSGSDITLSALGAANTDDLRINNGITVSSTGAGNVVLTAGGAVIAENNSVVSTTGTGTITVASGEDFTDFTLDQDGHVNGDVRMNNSAAFRSEDGNITVDARRNARISEVNADSNGDNNRGDVIVRARTGYVSDRNAAATNVTADLLTIESTTGVADSALNDDDFLETDINDLDLTNTGGTGKVQVQEVAGAGRLDILRANQGGTGDMTIRTTNGDLRVIAAGNGGLGVSATSGVTRLEANGGGANDDLVIRNTVTSTTGKIELRSTSRDVIANGAGDVTATGGAEIEAFAQRNIEMAAGTVWNANGGGTGGNSGDLGVGIDLDAATGNVTLGSVQTTSTAATSRGDANDAVTIDASLAVIDGGDTNDNIIANAGQTTINASTGVGSADAIETQIDRLDVVNNGFNAIRVTETAAGGALNIVRVDQQGPGVADQIEIQTLDGTLTVLSEAVGGFVGNGVTGLAGQIFLIANGVGNNDDLVLNNQVQSSTGKINLDSTSNDVIADAEGDVTATGGAEIESSAQRSITMADGTVWNANGGGTGGDTGDLGVGIDLDATNGDVTLGSVQTTSTASTSRGDANDAVSINALNGAVIDGGDTDDDIIANAGETEINTANGIGHGNSIETQIDRLDATNSTANDIDIREQVAGGALNIVRVDQNAVGGRIDVQTLDGTLTVLSEAVGGNAGNGVEGLDGEIFLRANGAGNDDDLVLNNQIESTTGKVNVDSSSRDVIADAEGDITATGGAEIESDAFRNITMADGTVWNANGGDAVNGGIDLDALNGDITLGSVQTTSQNDNAVAIFAKNGAIIDGGDLDVDITSGASTPGVSGTGGGILLKALTGIGSIGTGVNVGPNNAANNFATDALDTQGGRLAAQTEQGDIQISNTGGLEITTLSDTDGASPFTTPGAGTVTGVLNNDSTHLDAGSIIFITTHSPMTVSSAVTNLDGGNISLYALGSTPADTMTINANVQTFNGNADVRLVSGSSMTMGPGVQVSTSNDGVTSGTGQVFVGAGYDATGKAADEAVVPGATLFLPSASLFDTVGDAAANLTMDETATIWTENGNILVDAQNDFTVGRVDADGFAGAGITDGTRGDVTAFARNGSILDAETPDVVSTNLDFVADDLTMFANNTIGVPPNFIETLAKTITTYSNGSQFISNLTGSFINLLSTQGSIFFLDTGDILMGTAHAPNGEVTMTSGRNILSVATNLLHINAGTAIRLTAAGFVGTPGSPINTQLNNPGNITLNISGDNAGLSANLRSNVGASSIQFANLPPGIVLLNGAVIGGATSGQLNSSLSQLYVDTLPFNQYQNGRVDGRYAADFPGIFNGSLFEQSPLVPINTSALDTVGLEAVPPTVVPIPSEAATEEEKKKKPAEVPQPQKPQAAAVQQNNPPTIVPIPADATPTLNPDVENKGR